MSLHSLPKGNDGHWGPVTSTIDWCEENYVVSPYFAEFYNSLSSLFYVVAMINGIRYLNDIGVKEWRGYLAFLSTGIIGVGSFLFHGSLKFRNQMLDELPMVFGICMQLYNMLLIFPESSKYSSIYSVLLTACASSICIAYLAYPDPMFHEIMFGSLVAWVTFLNPWQIWGMTKTHTHLQKRFPSIWRLYALGVLSFLGAWIFWMIENANCKLLRTVRNEWGFPVSVLTQFHAFYWHFGTCLSVFATNLRVGYLSELAKGRDDVFLKFWFIFPWLEVEKGARKGFKKQA